MNIYGGGNKSIKLPLLCACFVGRQVESLSPFDFAQGDQPPVVSLKRSDGLIQMVNKILVVT